MMIFTENGWRSFYNPDVPSVASAVRALWVDYIEHRNVSISEYNAMLAHAQSQGRLTEHQPLAHLFLTEGTCDICEHSKPWVQPIINDLPPPTQEEQQEADDAYCNS